MVLGVAKEIAIITICNNIISEFSFLMLWIRNTRKNVINSYKVTNGKGEENNDQ